MGERARETARSDFGMGAIGDRLITVYNESRNLSIEMRVLGARRTILGVVFVLIGGLATASAVCGEQGT